MERFINRRRRDTAERFRRDDRKLQQSECCTRAFWSSGKRCPSRASRLLPARRRVMLPTREHICQASTNFIFDEMCGRRIGLPSMALSITASPVTPYLGGIHYES